MNMKKLLISLLATVSVAAVASPVPKFLPLLSGYNVAVPTNTAAGLGVTNTLYTTYNGQVLHSLTNDVINGTLQTNLQNADAFKYVELMPDANGDVNANTALFIYVGNTNWIPVVVTNSVGQYMVTNTWLLAPAGPFPNWMYPATTNYYGVYTNAATNLVTVTLYRAPALNPQGMYPASLKPFVPLWETTNTFSFSFSPQGIQPVGMYTNLPTTWLQGARYVYASITAGVNTGNSGSAGILVNQLGILQPQ